MSNLRVRICCVVVGLLTASHALAINYDECIALAQSDPSKAEQTAQSWAQSDGGAAALHCRAQALIGLGAHRSAIEILTDLGQRDATLPEPTRSAILLQAGELLIAEDEIGNAKTILNQSLELNETIAGYALLATAHGVEQDWQSALRTLDKGLDFSGPRAELLALRARTKRALGDGVAARADALWALELEPASPGAFLELGNIERSLGHREAARTAYLDAIAHDQTNTIADRARLRLQEMESEGG